VITGCSSPQGIGFATARALAREGHEVHATVRDHAHDAELSEGLDSQLTIHDLDVLDRSAIQAVVRAIGRIEVLINNAGYGLIGGVEQVDIDRVRASFETDVFGTVAVIQEVLPIMRRQPACACPHSATTSRPRQRSRRSRRRSPSSWRLGTCTSRTSSPGR
jgi:NAD(P)-dependent dehydrogenase (short-subunit alcohol dehydrogenase family)